MAALRGPARYRAWAVPALVVAVVAGGGWLATSGTASGHPHLPNLTPAQLLAKIETARPPSLTGTVAETASLGLPDLPGSDQSVSLSWTALISGSHTAKVWLDGAARQRVAILGTLSEAEIVHNGRDVWTYTSTSNQVSHTVLPAATGEQPRPAPSVDATTPIGVANTILKAIDPTTSVTVDPTQIVAGHDAYTLVIRPRDSRSTIREVTIAVDGKRFVPLQVQVFGAASTPALEIGFSRVSFSQPKASVFEFHTPRGATVVANPLQQRDFHRASGMRDKKQQPASSAPKPAATAAPKLIGSGWTTVVEFPNGLPAGAGAALLDRLPAPAGASGTRTLTTALINAVMLPDGRVFIGAVATSLLEHVAATTPR